MTFVCKTGVLAAHYHAPIVDGRERIAYFGLAHIGIDADGKWGVTRRGGRDQPGTACGALVALQREIGQGVLTDWVVDDDLEYSLLRRRLAKKIAANQPIDIVALTRLAHEAISEDLGHMTSLTVDSSRADHAIMTGIQIHGPNHESFVWPGTTVAVVSGTRHDIDVTRQL